MAGFMAKQLKKGMFEVIGLEKYLEQRFAELKGKLLGQTPSRAAAKPPKAMKPAPKAAPAPKQKAMTSKKAPVAPVPNELELRQLLAMLAKHPRKAELVRAGKEKDQLLRSLVPLYLARSTKISVNSGMISRFWKAHGLTYAQPNAAKALRQHVGYARKTKLGLQITPNGVKYVDVALKKAA